MGLWEFKSITIIALLFPPTPHLQMSHRSEFKVHFHKLKYLRNGVMRCWKQGGRNLDKPRYVLFLLATVEYSMEFSHKHLHYSSSASSLPMFYNHNIRLYSWYIYIINNFELYWVVLCQQKCNKMSLKRLKRNYEMLETSSDHVIFCSNVRSESKDQSKKTISRYYNPDFNIS